MSVERNSAPTWSHMAWLPEETNTATETPLWPRIHHTMIGCTGGSDTHTSLNPSLRLSPNLRINQLLDAILFSQGLQWKSGVAHQMMKRIIHPVIVDVRVVIRALIAV